MLTSNVNGYNKRAMEQRDKERIYFLKNFQNLILQYDYIVIFHHKNPDGDCLGASFGIKEIIQSNFPNKRVYVVGYNPNKSFSWMTMKFDNSINYAFDFSAALALIVDVGQSHRIDSFNKFFKNSRIGFGAVVKIDHHDSHSDFHVDLSWDDPTYVSTCCQIVQLAEFYGWKMSPKAATFLYLGICTDSKNFSIASVVPRSLILAAKTWRSGADYVKVHRKLRTRNWDHFQLSKYVIDKAVRTDHIVYAVFDYKDVERFKDVNLKSMVSLYEHIENLWVWMVMVEDSSGIFEVSIRSFKTSAKDLAVKYGGGGHEFAAGCKITGDQISDLVRDANAAVELTKGEMYHENFWKGKEMDPEEEDRIKDAVARKHPYVMQDVKDVLKSIQEDRENGEHAPAQKRKGISIGPEFGNLDI